MSESLTQLLNRCEAMFKSRFVTINECAAEIKEQPQRVSEWVTQRAHEPSGRVALKLHYWAARKSLQISLSDFTVQKSYRDTFRKVAERRSGKD